MSSLFETKKRYFKHKRSGAVGYMWLDKAPVINKVRITITESPDPMPAGNFHPSNMWDVGFVHILGRDDWLEKDWIEVENQTKT